jgi:hypothetical protein
MSKAIGRVLEIGKNDHMKLLNPITATIEFRWSPSWMILSLKGIVEVE